MLFNVHAIIILIIVGTQNITDDTPTIFDNV